MEKIISTSGKYEFTRVPLYSGPEEALADGALDKIIALVEDRSVLPTDVNNLYGVSHISLLQKEGAYIFGCGFIRYEDLNTYHYIRKIENV